MIAKHCGIALAGMVDAKALPLASCGLAQFVGSHPLFPLRKKLGRLVYKDMVISFETHSWSAYDPAVALLFSEVGSWGPPGHTVSEPFCVYHTPHGLHTRSSIFRSYARRRGEYLESERFISYETPQLWDTLT